MFLFVFTRVMASYNFNEPYDDYYNDYFYDYGDFSDFFPFIYDYPEQPNIMSNYVETTKEKVQEYVEPAVKGVKEKLAPVVTEVKEKTKSPAITKASKDELKSTVVKRPVTNIERNTREIEPVTEKDEKKTAKKSTKKRKREEPMEKVKPDSASNPLNSDLVINICIISAVIVIIMAISFLILQFIYKRFVNKTEMDYYRSLTRPRIEPENEDSQRRYAIRYG